MADRFPLILNTSNNQIQEIASGDNLDLTGSGISNAGIITAGNVTIGAATTDLIVTGDARITGILTIGTGSLTLDGPNNLVNVGTALTLGHTQGLQFHTQNLHSEGFEINQINLSGIATFNEARFGNSKRLKFGEDIDLQIYHFPAGSGTNYISAANNTGVVVSSQNVSLMNQNHSAYFFKGEAAGSIVYHNNTARVTTTGTGINVTGNNVVSGNVTAVDGTFSGNVSIGGTLTYEDVTNIDSVGIITAREGVFLPDLKQLKLGNTAAAPDLYIWHNSGTGNSNISNKTGDLFIQGNDGSGTVVNQIAVKSNAAVELNYQGGKRFETTGSGVNISGNLITNHSNGAIVNNGWGFLRQRFDTANYDSIKWQNAAASVDFCDIGYDIDTSTSPDSGILRLKGVGSKGRVLIIAGSVTIQFKEDREISGVGNIIPDTGSQYNIGSSSVKFANIYADTLHGNGNNLTQIVTAGSTYNSDLDTANTVAGVYRVNTGISNGHSGMTSYGTLFHANNAQDTGFQMYVNYNNGRAFLRGGNATTFNGTSGGGYVNTTWAEIAQSTQSFIPETNDSVDLGSTSKRWRNVYTNDLNLSNEGGKNKVDGTWGNYTIQEGESDLFLINNRNGKKYKFNLTEVS